MTFICTVHDRNLGAISLPKWPLNAPYTVLWLYAVIENFAPYYGTVYAVLRSYRRNYGKTGITVQTVINGGKSYKLRWVNRSDFEARVKVAVWTYSFPSPFHAIEFISLQQWVQMFLGRSKGWGCMAVACPCPETWVWGSTLHQSLQGKRYVKKIQIGG